MSYTNLQQYLRNRIIPWNTIRDQLGIDRSLPGKWARGALYPSRLASEKLIALFAEHGIELDYNDIYRMNPINQMELDEAV